MVFLCIACIVLSSIALHGIALHRIAWHCMVLQRLHGIVQLIWRAGELPRSASSHFVYSWNTISESMTWFCSLKAFTAILVCIKVFGLQLKGHLCNWKHAVAFCWNICNTAIEYLAYCWNTSSAIESMQWFPAIQLDSILTWAIMRHRLDCSIHCKEI